MRKILLVVALLLLAAPVFAADVTITATKVGTIIDTVQKVNIGYTGAAEANSIRAFALSITLDLTADANIQNIRDFNRGESKRPGGGYGIFPARLRQYITPLNGSQVTSTGGYGWSDGNYTPLAVWGDPNAGWGNNSKWIVVELGTLYQGEANAPGTSGTLFAIDVNGYGDCNLCIALDQIRGGVIKYDNTAATVDLPPGGGGAPAGCIKLSTCFCCINIPNIIGMTKEAAGTVLINAGYTPNGTGVVDCNCPYNTVCTQDTGCFTLPHTVSFTYSNGVTVPNIVGSAMFDANTVLVNGHLCVGTITFKYSDTVSAGRVISQNPAPGSCVVAGTCISYVVSLGRLPTPSQILYPKWDPDANLPIYWSQVAGSTRYELDRSNNGGSTWANVYTGAATFKQESVAPGIYRYRCRAANADSNSLYYSATYDCNAYLSLCYCNGNTSDPCWAQWKLVGRPDCWCKATTAQEPNGSGYQCDGDADGITSGAPFNYRVFTGDLGMVAANYKKTAAQLTADPNVWLVGKLKIHNSCADIDHKASGAPFNYRVFTGDLNIVAVNYKKLNSSASTATNRLPGNCPHCN